MENDKLIELWNVLTELEDVGIQIKGLSSLLGALDCYLVEGHYNPPKDLLSVPAGVMQQLTEKAVKLTDKAIKTVQILK